jgi:bacillithiol synthase
MRFAERKEQKLYREDALTSFFSITPEDPDGAAKSAAMLQARTFRRKEIADLLEGYNQTVGNDEVALHQIERLRDSDSICVMTGQQLGLFGGPAYTVLKAVSCLILARQQGAVPIFWLATEDHDADEIDHTYLLDNLGNLNKMRVSFPKDGRFVEDLSLTSELKEEMLRFCEAVDQKQLYTIIKEETSYARAMAKVMVHLFQGTGLVFVEPYLLRPLAKEFFLKEVTGCDAISATLQKTASKLRRAGKEPVLDVSEGSNLFLKVDGLYRRKIEREGKGYKVGKRRLTEKELQELIDEESERFSTNAAARCVLQNSLFPVLAYVAGPGELAYYAQLKEYHEYHGISVPWIVPRLSMTFLTPAAEGMLDALQIKPWEKIPSNWFSVVPNMETGAEQLAQEWLESAVRHFGEDLSSESMSRFIHFQSQKLQRKAVLSRLRRKGIAHHSLHYLNNLIHPHQKPQERVINWWEFQSRSKHNLIQELLNHLNTIPEGHLYCYL